MIYLRALPETMRVSVASLVAYRAEMVIWILSATLPLIMLVLWNSVAADGPVAGLDQDGVARYFASTLIVRQLTGAWIVWELNFEIRSGALSQKLLRPVHPLFFSATSTLGAVPFRALILAPLILVVVWWRPGLWVTPSIASFGLFVLSLSLAWLLAFFVQSFFGLLAFWFDRSLGLWGVWFALWTVMSGYIAPLGFYPESLQTLLAYSPFSAMLSTPVQLLGGFLEPAAALPLVASQLAWVVVFGGLVASTWGAGVRRYGAFGA